jgi:hypothetical protein
MSSYKLKLSIIFQLRLLLIRNNTHNFVRSRALAVKAEDVLDEYHYELLHHQVDQEEATRKSNIFHDSHVLPADFSFLESMAKKIKFIRRMFEEIERERDMPFAYESVMVRDEKMLVGNHCQQAT